jgi:hypothetical protein
MLNKAVGITWGGQCGHWERGFPSHIASAMWHGRQVVSKAPAFID